MARDNTRLPEIGAAPRADFLPPRIHEVHAARKNRHNLAIVTLAVTLLSVGTLLGFRAVESQSSLHLHASQQEAIRILSHQSAYSDMVGLIQESKELDAAYVVASERNVNWSSFIQRVQASLPAGGAVTYLSLTSPSAASSAAANGVTGNTPVVVANITLTSPTLHGVEYFLLDARQWDGYENAFVTSLDNKTGVISAAVQINFGAAALSPGVSEGVVKIGGGN